MASRRFWRYLALEQATVSDCYESPFSRSRNGRRLHLARLRGGGRICATDVPFRRRRGSRLSRDTGIAVRRRSAVAPKSRPLSPKAALSPKLVEPHLRILRSGINGQARVALTFDACMGKADERILSVLVASASRRRSSSPPAG
jgi:hypothetical protein